MKQSEAMLMFTMTMKSPTTTKSVVIEVKKIQFDDITIPIVVLSNSMIVLIPAENLYPTMMKLQLS